MFTILVKYSFINRSFKLNILILINDQFDYYQIPLLDMMYFNITLT